jgi:hypothetical protein
MFASTPSTTTHIKIAHTHQDKHKSIPLRVSFIAKILEMFGLRVD